MGRKAVSEPVMLDLEPVIEKTRMVDRVTILKAMLGGCTPMGSCHMRWSFTDILCLLILGVL